MSNVNAIAIEGCGRCQRYSEETNIERGNETRAQGMGQPGIGPRRFDRPSLPNMRRYAICASCIYIRSKMYVSTFVPSNLPLQFATPVYRDEAFRGVKLFSSCFCWFVFVYFFILRYNDNLKARDQSSH